MDEKLEISDNDLKSDIDLKSGKNYFQVDIMKVWMISLVILDHFRSIWWSILGKNCYSGISCSNGVQFRDFLQGKRDYYIKGGVFKGIFRFQNEEICYSLYYSIFDSGNYIYNSSYLFPIRNGLFKS